MIRLPCTFSEDPSTTEIDSEIVKFTPAGTITLPFMVEV